MQGAQPRAELPEVPGGQGGGELVDVALAEPTGEPVTVNDWLPEAEVEAVLAPEALPLPLVDRLAVPHPEALPFPLAERLAVPQAVALADPAADSVGERERRVWVAAMLIEGREELNVEGVREAVGHWDGVAVRRAVRVEDSTVDRELVDDMPMLDECRAVADGAAEHVGGLASPVEVQAHVQGVGNAEPAGQKLPAGQII